jgi:hypothetical protein
MIPRLTKPFVDMARRVSLMKGVYETKNPKKFSPK